MKQETDTLYEAFHTDERHESDFGYLWDQPIYMKTNRGAGYRKYIIQRITYLPDSIEHFKELQKKGPVKVMVALRGTHFTEKSKDIFATLPLELNNDTAEFQIQNSRRVYFASPLDYFVTVESLNIAFYRKRRKGKQYQFELQQIKTKYPEYFL